MRDVILLLYLHDEKYGKRLLRYLAGKKNPVLYPELVTVRERIEKRTASEAEELVVLTDDAGIREDSKRKVIYLSREMGKGKRKIYRYQKASGIYQDLMELLELKPMAKAPCLPEKRETQQGIFCLLDPEGGGSAALAVFLSQYLGKRGKCLYLNLTGFPLYYGETLQENPDFHTKGLAELLFCMNRRELKEEIKKLVKPFGCADMIPPFPHFKDLLDCGAKEWNGLLPRIRAECGYDNIVLEVGQLFEYTLDIMDQCEYPCLIRGTGLCGRIRTAVFRQYCRIEKKERLLDRCHVMVLPFEREEGMEILSRQTPEEIGDDESLMKRIRNWLEQLEKEEEDDCIIEEDG